MMEYWNVVHSTLWGIMYMQFTHHSNNPKPIISSFHYSTIPIAKRSGAKFGITLHLRFFTLITLFLFGGCAHITELPPEPSSISPTHQISEDGRTITINIPHSYNTSENTIENILAHYSDQKSYDDYFIDLGDDSIKKLLTDLLVQEIHTKEINAYKFDGLSTTNSGITVSFVEDTLQLTSLANNLIMTYGNPDKELSTPTFQSSPNPADYQYWFKHPLLFPSPDITLPKRAILLPNAPRDYRNGIHRGIDFFTHYGAEVRTVEDGVVIRADHNYQEVTPEFREALLKETELIGRTPSDIFEHILLGRSVFINHGMNLIPGKRVISIYAHLSQIEKNIQVGEIVSRGQRIGFTGNSGTMDGAQGKKSGAHLHFEIILQDKEGERFLGQGLQYANLIELLNGIFTEQ